MKIETINKLCCPFDKKDLVLKIITRDVDNTILEGVLTCSYCSRYYPIVSGIPIMSPDEYREKQLEAPLVEKWKPELVSANALPFRLPASHSDQEESLRCTYVVDTVDKSNPMMVSTSSTTSMVAELVEARNRRYVSNQDKIMNPT